MKKNPTSIRISVLAIFMSLVSVSAMSLTREVVTFVENFNNKGQILQQEFIPKELRVKRNPSRIIANNTYLPDSISKCVAYAFDIWESHLNCEKPIKVNLYFKPLSNDFETHVIYMWENNIGLPSSLYNNLNLNQIELPNYCDGKIYINSNVSWECGIGDNIDGTRPNLTFALMRSIAKILGFGSSIKFDENDELRTSNARFFTKFDHFILSSNNESITRFGTNGGKGNKEMTDFYSSTDRFYITKIAPEYELEKTPANGDFILSYFKNANSLMSFSPQKGSYFLGIDSLTTNVLTSIGWPIPEKPVLEIVCDEGDDTGIMSVYSPHKFYIKSDRMDLISNQKWTLSLPLQSGSDEVIFSNDNNSFILPAIDNPEKYQRNINGDIYAYLDFSCVIGGKKYSAATYRISLELKPKIEYAKIISVKQYPVQQTYDAYYEVKYYGAESITVDVEEEYGTWFKSKIIREPYLVKGVCTQITAPFLAWIDFTVRNKYGEDTVTIDLNPYGEVVSQNSSSTTIASLPEDRILVNDTQTDHIEIYNLQGVLLAKGSDINSLSESLKQGIYIIHERLESGKVLTRKLNIR